MTNCLECGAALPDGPYPYRYCPTCRSLYAIDRTQDNTFFQRKGRDRFTERLRDGFAMLQDDDDRE